MKTIIKTIAYSVLLTLRIPQLVDKLFFNNAVTVLTYHAVVKQALSVSDWCFLDEDIFRRQMAYMIKTFNVVPLSTAIDMIRSNDIQPRTAVITFDDGFMNNHEVVYPIMRELGIPFTIFLNTRFTDTEQTVWFCQINRALTHTGRTSLEWQGEKFTFHSSTEKANTSKYLQNKLKAFPQQKLLDETNRICKMLSDDSAQQIENEYNYKMLDSKAITEMSQSGLVEFGAHTHTHAILSRISKAEKLQEITASIDHVTQLAQSSCRAFAYPNGSANDFDMDSIDILQTLELDAALTMIPGPNKGDVDLLKIRRYGISNERSFSKFLMTVHHSNWILGKILTSN